MGRIRSIHPTTPTDPEFAANTVEGRLLALYSLTIADDAGNLERNPLGLKMALFPADEWATVKRITELVDTLIVGRFYEPYEVDGKQYLHVRNFAKYQKPDHPTAPRYPLFPGQEFTYHARQGNTWVPKTVKSSPPGRSVIVPRTLPEYIANVLAGEELELERKGKDMDLEGKGEDGRGPGREGEGALPSPPSGGGGAAASTKNDSGNATSTPSGKESNDNREWARTHAIVRVDNKEWSNEQAVEWLVNSNGFTTEEAYAALGVAVAG